MEQITIKKLNGEDINLFSTDPVSFVTQAVQDHTLMSTDTVKISFKSTEILTIEIGDKIQIVDDIYTIRTTTTREIVDEELFFYELTFYGSIYDLLKSQYRDADATGKSYSSSFDLTYTLKDFVKVVINNVNRDYPGKWTFDEANCPDTDPLPMNFSKQNCLNALQTICKEFKYDFYITQSNGVRTIHIGASNNIINPPGGKSHFEWGKGSGLYRLKEKSVDDKSIISRLWVEGGTQNIKSNYRDYSQRLQLPLARQNKKSHTLYDGTVIPAFSETIGISSEARRFMEDASLSIKLGGVVEDTEHYDHIYPQRTGEVTAKPIATEDEDGATIPPNPLSFIDSQMFDLTAKDEDENTLYLIDGVSAKITFISGRLAGQQFEIEKYDHATKTFTIIEFTDSRGVKFPSDAFPISVGDKYKLTDIVMPQSYIDEAEEDLWYAGYNDFLMRKQARVQYELTFDPMYFIEHLSDDVEMSLFKPGDYIPIKDERFDLEKNIRITNVKRNLLKDHDYVLTLSDTHTISIIAETVQDVLEHENVIVRNRLRDWTRARLAWRTTEELRNMVFDTDNFFDMGNIRPLSVDTNMLTVGSKSQQFVLVGVILQANADGLANKFSASAGQLAHLTIDPDDVRTWNMSQTEVILADLGGYYVYAKCSKEDDTAVWHITQQQLKAEDISDPNNYYFQVGIIGSLNTELSFRDFTTTYGFTRTNGRTITTGRISSVNGKTYIDLDDNVIAGNIRFLSNGGEQDLEEWSNDVVSDLDVVKGITDKFGTTVNGGLISTVMMLLRELNSTEDTAGISGIQHSDQNDPDNLNAPAFWAGGTYEQAFSFTEFLFHMKNETPPGINSGEFNYVEAYNNLPEIVMLHNGAAKTGDFIIEDTGQIVMIDPATGIARLTFSTHDIPTVESLRNNYFHSGSVDIWGGIEGQLTGTLEVDNDGTLATFNGVTLNIEATGYPNEFNDPARATLYYVMEKDGNWYKILGQIELNFWDQYNPHQYQTRTFGKEELILDKGTYTFRLATLLNGNVTVTDAYADTTTIDWRYDVQGVNRQQYGRNGMMFYYEDNHLHFTKEKGFDVRGQMNMPGILAAGSSTSGGAQSNVWGAKANSSGVTPITGGFRVPLKDLTHNQYVVQVTPHTSTTFRVGLKTSTYFEVFGNGGFDYVVIGNNY